MANNKIYVLGDSISIHYGPYLKIFLEGILDYSRKEGEEEALLNLDNPQGANGGDSSTVLNFLIEKIRSGGIQADILLVNCGLHDIRTNPTTGIKQIAQDQYEKNLHSIIIASKKLQTKMVWISTTPCDETIHNVLEPSFHRYSTDCVEYNEVAKNIMSTAGIPIVDLFAFTSNLGSELYCDHVHFTDSVRQKQAAFIAGWLQCFLLYQE